MHKVSELSYTSVLFTLVPPGVGWVMYGGVGSRCMAAMSSVYSVFIRLCGFSLMACFPCDIPGGKKN